MVFVIQKDGYQPIYPSNYPSVNFHDHTEGEKEKKSEKSGI